MKKVKSNMTRDFDVKHAMRNCMADGGAIRKGLADMDAQIDSAVKGPKPAAKPAAKPAEEPDDSAIGIHIPKPPKPAPAPAKKGLLGLGFMGLRNGGFIDDGEDPVTARPVSPDPKSFERGGAVRGPGGPTDDKVPAMLSDGEFVLPADTVKKVGAHNLEALRRATHTPVKMVNGGLFDDDVKRTNQVAASGSAFGPMQAGGDAGNPNTFDARDLRFANQDSGQYTRAVAAAVPTGGASDMDARDLRLQADQRPSLRMPSAPIAATSTTDLDPAITRTGNTFSGVGNAPSYAPGQDPISVANANARAEMQRMDAAKNAQFASQRDALVNASNQNQARFDAEQRDKAFQSALRDPNMTRSAKARLLQAREQDIQREGNVFNRAVTMRGQDIGAETSRRGQDLGASTALRGQDVSLANAAAERDVQTRGQDLSAYSNQALRQLQTAQFQRSIQQQDRQFGFEQSKEQRAARQEGYKNLQDSIARASSTLVDGKSVTDPAKAQALNDKIAYTTQQLGMHPGDVPPELQQELIRRAAEASDREDAAKGLTGWLAQKMGLAVTQETRDLRNINPTGFQPGAITDTVNTPVGPVTRRDFVYGGPSKSGYTNFNALPVHERQQDLEELMKKLRSPR